MITEGTSDRGPQYINIHDPISHMVDNTNASSVSKAKVGSRIKSNFKALGTRYCDAIKGEKRDDMKTGEIFAAIFIGVFMSPFLFLEGTIELIKAIFSLIEKRPITYEVISDIFKSKKLKRWTLKF